MRRATRLAAAVLAVAVLGGCATGTPVEPDPDVPIGRYSTPEVAVPMEGLGAAHYVETIRGLIASRPHVEQSDADLIQGGRDLCAEIDAGATWATFAEQIERIDGDPAFYRAVVRAAILSFCIEDATILR